MGDYAVGYMSLEPPPPLCSEAAKTTELEAELSEYLKLKGVHDPAASDALTVSAPPGNRPCPCGSGLKYKCCCGLALEIDHVCAEGCLCPRGNLFPNGVRRDICIESHDRGG